MQITLNIFNKLRNNLYCISVPKEILDVGNNTNILISCTESCVFRHYIAMFTIFPEVHDSSMSGTQLFAKFFINIKDQKIC